ncbi:uncharacterized protein ACO6RY_04689 [Pungitius sinensis]
MAFYLKLATALCLAVAVPQSDPRLSLSAVSSAYAGRGRAVRRDLGGTLSIRCRAVGASPRSLRLVKSVGDETFTLAARGASPRKVMVDAVIGGTGSVLLVVAAGPPPSQHSRKFPKRAAGGVTQAS